MSELDETKACKLLSWKIRLGYIEWKFAKAIGEMELFLVDDLKSNFIRI
jgi:hypothetical protein